jgi:hypothetical protein
VVAYIDEDPDTVVIVHSPRRHYGVTGLTASDGKVVVIGDDPNTMSHAVLEDRAFQRSDVTIHDSFADHVTAPRSSPAKEAPTSFLPVETPTPM